MIKAKDVMVGNWVSFKGLWNGQVEGVSDGILTIKYNGGIFYPEYFSGIPLSEEILLKCGFEQVDIFAEYRKGSITLGLVIGGENQYQLIINGFCTSVILKSLHDLQNVYKIFEKQELEIKL